MRKNKNKILFNKITVKIFMSHKDSCFAIQFLKKNMFIKNNFKFNFVLFLSQKKQWKSDQLLPVLGTAKNKFNKMHLK